MLLTYPSYEYCSCDCKKVIFFSVYYVYMLILQLEGKTWISWQIITIQNYFEFYIKIRATTPVTVMTNFNTLLWVMPFPSCCSWNLICIIGMGMKLKTMGVAGQLNYGAWVINLKMCKGPFRWVWFIYFSMKIMIFYIYLC